MGETVSKELREVLNNPATRHLVLDVWLERKAREQRAGQRPSRAGKPGNHRTPRAGS